jgi:hypothetical protein
MGPSNFMFGWLDATIQHGYDDHPTILVRLPQLCHGFGSYMHNEEFIHVSK